MPSPLKLKKAQKTPDDSKNFLQNYSDHAHFLGSNFQKNLEKSLHSKGKTQFSDNLYAMCEEIFSYKHILTFDALRDRYDYMDEFVGATLLPMVSFAASCAALAMAIYEGGQALAIRYDLNANDEDDHNDRALNCLYTASTLFAISMASFVKSVISLITRPIVTAVNGWKNQDVERFINNDSVQGKLTGGLNELVEIFSP